MTATVRNLTDSIQIPNLPAQRLQPKQWLNDFASKRLS